MKLSRRLTTLAASILAIATLAAGCGNASAGTAATTAAATAAASTTSKATEASTAAAAEEKLSGEVRIDGSSTVFPITEAVAEEFLATNPDVKVPVGVSGTGGGFKKFIAKEIDIADASRGIKDEEATAAKDAGISYLELKVAFDGLTVVVNKENTWATTLTVDQLKAMWNKDSTVKTWADVNPEWPAEEIKFYAPGTDSGTFEYFTEAINKEKGNIRPDFVASEDDNVLVQGVAGDKNGIAFFGYAYYEENIDKLAEVAVDNGSGPVVPTYETIKDGTYAPLSRPLYLYVNEEALARPEVKGFLRFYMENAADLVDEVGYVALPAEDYAANLEALK